MWSTGGIKGTPSDPVSGNIQREGRFSAQLLKKMTGFLAFLGEKVKLDSPMAGINVLTFSSGVALYRANWTQPWDSPLVVFSYFILMLLFWYLRTVENVPRDNLQAGVAKLQAKALGILLLCVIGLTGNMRSFAKRNAHGSGSAAMGLVFHTSVIALFTSFHTTIFVILLSTFHRPSRRLLRNLNNLHFVASFIAVIGTILSFFSPE